jgi:hypothetical protein
MNFIKVLLYILFNPIVIICDIILQIFCYLVFILTFGIVAWSFDLKIIAKGK